MAKDKVKEAPKEEADAESEDGEVAPAKKKLPLKMMIIAGVAALVVLGGGGTAAFIFLKPKPDAAHAEKAGHEKKKEKKKEKGGHGDKKGEAASNITEGPDGVVFYTMPDVTVNMQTADGKPTFLKLKLTLELPDEAAVETLDPNMPRLQDMFQTFLRELRPEDLNGSAAVFRIKEEMIRGSTEALGKGMVRDILIQDLIQQ